MLQLALVLLVIGHRVMDPVVVVAHVGVDSRGSCSCASSSVAHDSSLSKKLGVSFVYVDALNR